jgi:hypothetical protein
VNQDLCSGPADQWADDVGVWPGSLKKRTRRAADDGHGEDTQYRRPYLVARAEGCGRVSPRQDEVPLATSQVGAKVPRSE